MPRKGKGGQANRNVTGQQYGQATAQEESQDIVPLAKMDEIPQPSLRAGQMNLRGPSNKPQENIMAKAMPRPEAKKISTERLFQIQAALPALELRASQRDASFQLRKLVREMKIVVRANKDTRLEA